MPSISPSRAAAKELCPKYDRIPSEAGDAADEGILLHESVEREDITILDTDEQVKQAEVCIEYARSIRAQLTEVEEWNELEIEMRGFFRRGYIDRLIIGKDKEGVWTAYVIDWKFGQLPVEEARTNFQVGLYSLYVKRTFEPTKVIGVVVSPRRSEILTHEFTEHDFEDLVERFNVVARKVEDPFSVPTPDDRVCQNCKWAHKCPALHKDVTAALQVPGIAAPATFEVKLASDEDRSKAQAWAAILSNLGDQLKKANNEYIKQNPDAKIPGFSVRKRAGNTSIDDHEGAIAVLTNLMPADDILRASKISLAKLAEQVVNAGAIANKKEARAWLEEHLEGYLKQGAEITYLQRERDVTPEQLVTFGLAPRLGASME